MLFGGNREYSGPCVNRVSDLNAIFADAAADTVEYKKGHLVVSSADAVNR